MKRSVLVLLALALTFCAPAPPDGVVEAQPKLDVQRFEMVARGPDLSPDLYRATVPGGWVYRSGSSDRLLFVADPAKECAP